jgi:hypothetical protein
LLFARAEPKTSLILELERLCLLIYLLHASCFQRLTPEFPDKDQPERPATDEEIKNKVLENEQNQLERVFGGSKLTINIS